VKAVEALDLDWPVAWEGVAAALIGHDNAGRSHLLTEDVVRFELVKALQGLGLGADRMKNEHRVPSIGPIDLVIDVDEDRPERMAVAIEIKFPRDSKVDPSAVDQLTFGELANDFYRLARIAADDRWALQVIGSRLAKKLSDEHKWTFDAGHALPLGPDFLRGLGKSARRAVAGDVDDLELQVTCQTVIPAGDLTVAAFRVAPSATLAREASEEP
jgi:hypothetical protein